MPARFDSAERFMLTHARLLERLLFAVRFQDASPRRVESLLSACQNEDGGLGHALEPDVRCSESQPLFVEFGLVALREAGLRSSRIAGAACDYAQGVSHESGFVPILLPSALTQPRAAHWQSAGAPGLNPTAGICGLLHWHGISHPWLERATNACVDALLGASSLDAHSLLSSTRLVDHIPDRSIAATLRTRIAELLPTASFFVPTAPSTSYGMTPLHFAPTPESPWRELFTDDQIQGHLEDLASGQRSDGGWAISWPAVSEAAEAEWRGRWTLDAISVLSAYLII